MPVDIESTALLGFLKLKNIGLYSKVFELRAAIEGWLSYIPQTFPHYTRHTVGHSDGIVLQVSRLIFVDNDPTRPVVNISPMEGYIVAAAAYLHDAGMVTSDEEKVAIVGSDEWREWTTGDGPGAKRWLAIQDLRNSANPPDESLRHFLADVETRFLVAEFVRRAHHLRAKRFMVQNQHQLGLFALNNNVLLRTIADVCISHGLEQRELEDRERYPDRRDIENDEVNVRFAAILLRLGDLLEMSHDRACPLLSSAACPLPSESYAHWTQYQRIVHSLTAPDRIELKAECENQEEHRFLRDWCQWLASEVKNASVLMSRSTRHSDWQLPATSIGGPEATINIVPSPNLLYA
jgi:molecular chaperone HtpG